MLEFGVKEDAEESLNTSMREVFEDMGLVPKRSEQARAVAKQQSGVGDDGVDPGHKESFRKKKDDGVGTQLTAKLNPLEGRGVPPITALSVELPSSQVTFFDRSDYQNVKPKRPSESCSEFWLTSPKVTVVSTASRHLLKPSDQSFLGRFCVIWRSPVGRRLNVELEVKRMSIRDRYLLVGLVSSQVRDALANSHFRCPMLDEAVAFNGYDRSLAFKGKCDVKCKNAMNGLEVKSRLRVVVDGDLKTIRVWDGQTYGSLFDLTADFSHLGTGDLFFVVGLDSPSTEVELEVVAQS